NKKFHGAFKRLTSLRTAEVNRASVAGLTEAQCKQALILSCKMLEDVNMSLILEMGLKSAFLDIYQRLTKQYKTMMNEATNCLKESADQKKDLMSKMEDEQQKLIVRAEKAAKESEALRMELETLKASKPKDEGEASELRRLLAQADADLCSLRESTRELTEKATYLEEQLAKY
ncbi:hypothetical protein AAVH_41061, partial [Aphelenchoides avenae]